MNFKRIRKAVVAGAMAGLGASVSYQLGIGWHFDAEHIGLTLSAFAAAAVPAAAATYKVKNQELAGPVERPVW